MRDFLEMMLQRRAHDAAAPPAPASPSAAEPGAVRLVRPGAYFLLEEYGAVDEILARKTPKPRRPPANFDGS